MSGKKVKITMVAMKEPCAACVITGDLLRETLEKLRSQRDDVEVSCVLLEHPGEAAGVEGLEVERYPALIINGEQVSAGSLLTVRQLNEMIDSIYLP